MVAVHQFVPTFAARDAVGTHARHARAVLRELGVESEIFAEGIAPGAARRQAHHYTRFGRRTGTGAHDRDRTWLLYQLSTGSKLADWLLARPEPKLVNYHNVTPFSTFAPWEPVVGAELKRGREQLAAFAPETELGIAVSAYNEAELRAAGYGRTTISPVLVDLDAFVADPDPKTLDRLHTAKAAGGADWLFVGRVAPHKCQHDLIKAFALYRRVFDHRARLHIVGGMGSHAYWSALERYVRALGLRRNVFLVGSVPDAALAAHYRAADVFVCLSGHEGFCVPLIEAMRDRLPIVAFAAAAVPETLADAGLLLDRKDPATVAAAVHRVVADPVVRKALVAAGVRRAAAFTFEHARRRFAEVMTHVLERSSP